MTLVVVIDNGKDDNVLDTGCVYLTRVLTNVSITRMYIHCSAPFYEHGHEAVVVSPLGQGRRS